MTDRIKEMITELGMFHDSELYEIAEAVVRECAKLTRNLSPHGEFAEKAVLEHFGMKK